MRRFEFASKIIPIKGIEFKGNLPFGKHINELAFNIKEKGLLTPIIVLSRHPLTGLWLLSGKRRLAAVKKLKWKEISAVILPESWCEINDVEQKEFLEIIKEFQKNPPSDFKVAKFIDEMKGREFLTMAEISRLLGYTPSYVYNLSRWYQAMPPSIRAAWHDNHPLLNQVTLERFSHLSPRRMIFEWHNRLSFKKSWKPDKNKPSEGKNHDR